MYAGWLGKVIGVRHGAPIEGWLYERIKNTYGEIDGYIREYKNFAADDDTNGPLFFIRALMDYSCNTKDLSEKIALTWLNYVPENHGFFWWGGYGISTEQTAYYNLKNGIMPPVSGSIELNGPVAAQQIGGQIFIDTWGLIAPCNPLLAAEYASKAACVSHGGSGIYGAMFIAACISVAFMESDIVGVINSGLSVIPQESEYCRVMMKVMEYWRDFPGDWRQCFEYVCRNFGYDRYPGACHIIPNSAVIVLSMLYGRGDFSRTLNICNMCGWDTDCNVGNVGTIMGVFCGLDGIDSVKWRKPVNDFLAASSLIGSMNITNIPETAYCLARLGYKAAGKEPPAEWKRIIDGEEPRFNFELPGSTHAFRIAVDRFEPSGIKMENSTDFSHGGKRSLKISGNTVGGGSLFVYHKTYYSRDNFDDNRYQPAFSPILYPGQRITAYVLVPGDAGSSIKASLYVKDCNNGGQITRGEYLDIIPGSWMELQLNIPFIAGGCLSEAGLLFEIPEGNCGSLDVYIDDFDFLGSPNYSINFEKESNVIWNIVGQIEVSQFTFLKGIWRIEDGSLSGSCADCGEAYTGNHDWSDYIFEAEIIPMVGHNHFINFRVQGAARSYAAGFVPGSSIVLSKNNNRYTVLKEAVFDWEYGRTYKFKVEVIGQIIKIWVDNMQFIEFTDNDNPYLKGMIGASITNGSHCHYRNFRIKGISPGFQQCL